MLSVKRGEFIFLSNKTSFPPKLFISKEINCTSIWHSPRLPSKIHQLPLSRGIRTPYQLVSWYDTKKSDGEVPVMLRLWGMRSTRSLPSLPGSIWPGVVVPDRDLSMDQIELKCILMQNWITWNRTVLIFKCVLTLNWIVWNRTPFDTEAVLR